VLHIGGGVQRRVPQAVRKLLDRDVMVSKLVELDKAINDGQPSHARKILSQLSLLPPFLPDDQASDLRKLVDDRHHKIENIAVNLRFWGEVDPAPVSVKCSLCGAVFARAVQESWRKSCYVCLPTEGDSVRTVSGGLPTLGKKRR
jgi:hypothetical protein